MECTHCGKKDLDEPDAWDCEVFYLDLTEKFFRQNKKKERLLFLKHCLALNDEVAK